MASKQSSDQATVSFKDTLNLPHTDFPIHPKAAVDDPAMIARWEKEDLFGKTFTHNKGAEKFILHDGPPYANGHLHLGHAYNNILKDIVTKSQRMMGKHVPVTPGWDCHGLPIELKVASEHPGLSPEELKKECRAYAAKWIDVQREERKRLGVTMDWQRPYTTMSPDYEAATLRAFGAFVADGYIERKNKTVPWCPSCQTVLATAEIEYHDRKDPSIYVLFPLDEAAGLAVFPGLTDKPINLLIWTTTPWTLPLNRAVTMRPDTEYVVLDTPTAYVLVAKERADAICALVKIEKKIVAECMSGDLVYPGSQAYHPFIEGLKVPLILDQSVSLDDGTAFVHCAPGCGPEDYEVAVRNNLEIFSPISATGMYTSGIVPEELEGKSVTEGQGWVIKKLAENNRLFHKHSLTHSYPHCWRCRNGLIFRATRQWFCDLAKGSLKIRVLDAINSIQTIPEKSINQLRATVEGRLEWCLSRQRVWGSPIVALLCTTCDYSYVMQGLIEKVAEGVAQHGIEYWDTVAVEDLLPKGFVCPLCRSNSFKKETDILDVWFDSGVSQYAVLRDNPELGFPADMYLEGKDQHRGWFQSSLLTSMVLNNQAPMKIILAHGYTVDEQGRKMSKSLGNGVEPQEVIDKVGTDGLRLWGASIDCSGEVVMSQKLLENVSQVFRKVRNTCRFLLSNLSDYDHTIDAVPLEKMLAIDQYALQQLHETNKAILASYAQFDFTAISHKLGDYCAVDLSAFYLDIIKDRLYVEKADGPLRRSAQTACWYILDTLTKAMAPILAFTAEQVSDHYQKNKTESIHLQSFAYPVAVWHQTAPVSVTPEAFALERDAQWQAIKNIRSAILKAIEGLREKGIIKHSLESHVTIYLDDALRAQLSSFLDSLGSASQQIQFFKELLIVSQWQFANSTAGLQSSEYPGLYVHVERAKGTKCPRCWNWEETNHEHGLCSRCQAIVGAK